MRSLVHGQLAAATGSLRRDDGRAELKFSIEPRLQSGVPSYWAGRVTFSYAVVVADRKPVPTKCSVELEQIPCRFGGVRWWWRCPGCARCCLTVYWTTSVVAPRCRQCHGLGYRTQLLNRRYRLEYRSAKLVRRLGGDPEDQNYPAKPKWMRWRTYHKTMDELEWLDEAWNHDAAAGFALFLSRIERTPSQRARRARRSSSSR